MALVVCNGEEVVHNFKRCALVEQLGERVVSYGKEERERERERERAIFYFKNIINRIKKKLSLLSYSKLSSFAKNFKYTCHHQYSIHFSVSL